MIRTPQHRIQQHPYAKPLDSRYYYPATPRHRIVQSETHQSSLYSMNSPMDIGFALCQSLHHHPDIPRVSISSRILTAPHTTATRIAVSCCLSPLPLLTLLGHYISSGDQYLPGPMLFPAPAATLPNYAWGFNSPGSGIKQKGCICSFEYSNSRTGKLLR